MSPENDWQHRDLTTREWQFRADTLDAESRSVEAVLTTEAPAQVMDWRTWEVIQEVLRFDKFQAPADMPFCESHRRMTTADQIGIVRNIRVENGDKLVGRIFYAKNDPAADLVWNKVEQGMLKSVSIGYLVGAFVDIQPNKKASVLGKDYVAGDKRLRITTDWTAKEASQVVIGADQFAKLRSEISQNQGAAPQKNQEERTMPENVTQEEASGAPQQQSPPVGGAKVQPVAAPANVVDVEAERKAAIAGENKRQADIRELAERHNIDAATIKKVLDDTTYDLNRAGAEFLEAKRTQTPPAIATGAPGVIIADHEQRRTADVLASALLHRFGHHGMPALPKYIGEKKLAELKELAERSYEYSGMDIRDIIQECARIDQCFDPVTNSRPVGREAMFRAAVSGATFGSIFTTSVNAGLMAGFEQAGDTTQGWTMDADVNNFQSVEAISLGKTAQLEKLPRGGTAKHATISDSEETYKIARYAEQWVVDEQDAIDDRLGALSRVPFEMGQAAARMRPDLVYAIILANDTLTDGGALFNSTAETTAGGHANLGTDAFAAAALRTAVGTFKKRQQDLVNLNLEARFLLVATELEMLARETLNSQQLMVAGTTDVDRGNHNVIADLGLQLRSDGRLSNGVVDPATGTSHSGTATGWYLSAAPSQVPTIVVAVLAGTGGRPQTRPFTLSQGQWGYGWDIKLDIGAKALSPRGLYCGKA